jgi:DNA polymerase I-like protein with 3'-5' exonuclease and polymerase domains
LNMDIFSINDEMQSTKVEMKPWMVSKVMELGTKENLPRIIEECIKSKFYALDLETTGLDNRVIKGETVDKIVGVCLSPDGIRGYYIPLRHTPKDKITGRCKPSPHNIPLSFFRKHFKKLMDSDSVAIFHNAKFDLEFLEFNGGEKWGDWDDDLRWEDTLILAYLSDTRMKVKGLKALAKKILDYEMLELEEIFPSDYAGTLDFSFLDPSTEEVVWYGAGDGICTYLLFNHFLPRVCDPTKHTYNNFNFTGELPKPEDVCYQYNIYRIEKKCLTSIRWMERNRIHTDHKLIGELICIGQEEYINAISSLYDAISKELGRNVMPNFIKIWKENIILDDPNNSIMVQLESATRTAKRTHPDPTEPIIKGNSAYPYVYDVQSAHQLGKMFEEMKVPGLNYTENSGQVKTSKDELDRIIKNSGDQFDYMKHVKKFREVQKALSTYLFPLYEDADPRDHTIRINFNSLKVDTGRFSTPGKKKKKRDGGHLHGYTRYNLQSTPATYDPNRPKCMQRIRDCIVAPEGKIFAAIDFAGVELRIVTNLSKEPLWLTEFFRCGDCSYSFEEGTPIPPFCPKCGSDKIGDLHSLTALSVYGEDARNRDDWKNLRKYGKGCNFALCYGGGPNAVQNSVHCTTAEAYRIKKVFDKTYRVLSGWWKNQHQKGRHDGYVLTAFGRKYPVPDITHENGYFRSKAERNAVNGPVQGTSADITKIAMFRIYTECKKRDWLDKVQMIITMHDELCFVIDKDVLEEALKMITKEMTQNPVVISKYNRKEWKVPLLVDVELGHSWNAPWDLNKMRQSGEWPDELVGYFEEAKKAKERIEQGLPPVEKQGLINTKEQTRIKKFIYTAKQEINSDFANKLAEALFLSKSDSEEAKIVSIFNRRGKKISTSKFCVSEQLFLKNMGVEE